VDPWLGYVEPAAGPDIVIRVDRHAWEDVLQEINEFTSRERAGVLFVTSAPRVEPELLIGLEWMPVPDEHVIASDHGLTFDGRFNLRVAERAAELRAGAVLVHAHPGGGPPRPSETDARSGAAFLQFLRRRCPDTAHGLLVVADTTITGIIETATNNSRVARVVAAGIPLRSWDSESEAASDDDEGEDRQLLAIGAAAQKRLAEATIAVLGNSGGGSHVTQQLIHAGAGELIVIDPDVVEITNLRRLVGATIDDLEVPKPEIAVRTAAAVRPTVKVIPLAEAFPSTTTINALRRVDVIIGCLDGWDVRDDLNTFAVRHRIPYIDIGIAVAGPTEHLGMRVGGQIAVVTPDGPCLRCMGLVTDERVEASRRRRQGYADNEPEPQVVSLNGTVASEAVTTALMLLAGDHRIARRRRYAYPPGILGEVTTEWRPGCPACGALQRQPTPDGPTAGDAEFATAARDTRTDDGTRRRWWSWPWLVRSRRLRLPVPAGRCGQKSSTAGREPEDRLWRRLGARR
jgi:molybdopterin/thiamine biosynthesis adenylyltransferase